MTMDDVNRIENQKLLDKLAADQAKVVAEAKRSELAKMVEPIEFKEPEDVEPEAAPTPEVDALPKAKKGKKAE